MSTSSERRELLELYKDLRVADVRDGMDWNMMHHYGSMSYDIKALLRMRVCGIARTARYVPYQGNVPQMSPEEYTEWQFWYESEICPAPWCVDIEEGDFMVIDGSGIDSGFLGSNNSLAFYKMGIRGYVIDGGIRDTDELILEKIPVWYRMISQKMIQGRMQYEAKDVPVTVGGVVVCPGDVVVADGDGVIVVPRKIAINVAKYAHQELGNDKAGRRALYEEMGRELDSTVI